MAPGYTTRQPLPHMIEIGRETVLSAPVYLSGALVTPSEGIVTIYDEKDEVFDTDAVTIADGVATFTVAGSATSDRSPSGSWRVEWELVVDGATVAFRDEAYLVRHRLRPVISDVDVGQRVRALSIDLPGRATTATTYQPQIDEADVQLQSDLIALGRRPWLVVSPSALRECWLSLTIATILEGLAVAAGSQGDPYSVRAAEYRTRYDLALSRARVAMDWDDDGAADAGERTGPRPAGVWLC